MEIFRNKVAVVTGAAQGIGLEICQHLAKEGASIILNDINKTLAEAAATSIQNAGGSCTAYVGDASDIDFIERMVAYTVTLYGKLDIVIANAGITSFGDFFTYTPEDFNKVIKLNLAGSFFLVQSAAKHMRERKIQGRILLMSSVTGHQAHKHLAAYGMSKAALEMLAKTLVIELSPYQITINAIAPGATLTERTMSDSLYESTWSTITPTGRPAMPSDIAQAALFFVSPQAGHITGQTLIIDGGWSCVSPSPY